MGIFGFIEDVVDGAIETADDFVHDPINTTVRVVTQPLRDGIEVVQGLTEGELRVHAAARLGADIVAGMALSELVEWYNE
jgi:hypothetical protein